MSNFISAVEIAKSICVAYGDTNYSRIARVLASVGRAADDVLSNAIPHIKSEFIRIQDNLTAPLPCGAANVIKVGVVNNYGQIIHLYEDSRLRRGQYNTLLKKAENCDADTSDIEDSIITLPVSGEYYPGDYFHNCSHSVGNYGELYGYRFDPATIGTWRSVADQGYIEFGSGAFIEPGRFVLVEYKDASENRLSFIPHEAYAVIEARTRYYLSAGTNMQRIAIQDFKREYVQFKRLVLRKPIEDYLRAIGDDKPSPSSFVTSSTLSSTSTTSTSTSTSTVTVPRKLNYYVDDDAAIADGLAAGDEYLLSFPNNYDLPGGIAKFVYNGPV